MSRLDWGDLGLMALSASLASAFLWKMEGKSAWMLVAIICFSIWVVLLLLAIIPRWRSRLIHRLERAGDFSAQTEIGVQLGFPRHAHVDSVTKFGVGQRPGNRDTPSTIVINPQSESRIRETEELLAQLGA